MALGLRDDNVGDEVNQFGSLLTETQSIDLLNPIFELSRLATPTLAAELNLFLQELNNM